MKINLGLDLGTNSIGWALIRQHESENQILGAGSRIIPMSQDVLGEFDSGVSVSQTAERTAFRAIRRLRERQLLRRERLHRALNVLGFLPEHYAAAIDFEQRKGQFLPEQEPKLPYSAGEFLFAESFQEMLSEFRENQPEWKDRKIPYDWTVYYLRKKALTKKIQKQELAWILLQFNRKRGYAQVRGEEEEETPDKKVEFHELKVVAVSDTGDRRGKDSWYAIHLENGWIYRRVAASPPDWIGQIREFIVTTELNTDGSIKKDREGNERRSFRAPAEGDWTLQKKKTEYDIDRSKKTVGEYLYDSLLTRPDLKIRGQLVRVVERKYYKEELRRILEAQVSFHPELQNRELFDRCVKELYDKNENHRTLLAKKDFVHLFLEDILFYQRPLKSKKHLIADCRYESRPYAKDGQKYRDPIKGAVKSHPLFQEFRLWEWIENLRIFQREKLVNGKLEADVPVDFLSNENEKAMLFQWLMERKEIKQKELLNYFLKPLKLKAEGFRWNYVEEKSYPCNETGAAIRTLLGKVEQVPEDFLTPETEEALWHILYSVETKDDLRKALTSFAGKHELSDDFAEVFVRFPPFPKDYAAYSLKAIRRLLALMRAGKYWSEEAIDAGTRSRIEKLITGEFDEKISERTREKTKGLTDIRQFRSLPLWLAAYVVYDRHSEDAGQKKWTRPEDIELLEQHSLRNPIVEQVVNETLRVVKDIWLQYGNGREDFFDEIHLELSREMKNPAEERKRITAQVNTNENTNLRIRALLAELALDPAIGNVRPYSPMQQDILRLYEEGVLAAEGENIPEDILKITKAPQPGKSELIRYKCWLEQRYKSPYTGQVIPLSKLFSPEYEIEHIIPRARFFDDSFTNKVICETAVNRLKGNKLAYEFIAEAGGTILQSLYGKDIPILLPEAYEYQVKETYGSQRGKMKRLLMTEIPEDFVARQLNDSRYISKVVKNLLSNLVREEGEEEVTAKRLIVVNGKITDTLKKDWGVNDVWNELISPRFERMNVLTDSQLYGTINPNTRKFLPEVPLLQRKGFSKKRIDHRHHAMDALVIACTTRDHVNYLNNQSALGKAGKDEKQRRREDLRGKLCDKVPNGGDNYNWVFRKPWQSFTVDVREALSGTIVSHKKNVRILTLTMNRYEKWVKEGDLFVKKLVQQSGRNLAIRKSLHKATVAGLVTLVRRKKVRISLALDNWSDLVDKELRAHISSLVKAGKDRKALLKYFKENGWKGSELRDVEIFYKEVDKDGTPLNAATRVSVNESFSREKIASVTDTGIQKILLNHLEKFTEYADGKPVEHPELAFSPDGLEALNRNLIELNDGRQHQPIRKVRIYEPKGNKFPVGQTGNKKEKFVEADKGTNLFFGVYINPDGKRRYETIPLTVVLERRKQGFLPVPERDEFGNSLLFSLSPGDLMYVPGTDETIFPQKWSVEETSRIYKMVSCTRGECYFVRHDVAVPIVNKLEFSPLNKMERSWDGVMIKEAGIKIRIDRLGNVKPV